MALSEQDIYCHHTKPWIILNFEIDVDADFIDCALQPLKHLVSWIIRISISTLTWQGKQFCLHFQLRVCDVSQSSCWNFIRCTTKQEWCFWNKILIQICLSTPISTLIPCYRHLRSALAGLNIQHLIQVATFSIILHVCRSYPLPSKTIERNGGDRGPVSLVFPAPEPSPKDLACIRIWNPRSSGNHTT